MAFGQLRRKRAEEARSRAKAEKKIKKEIAAAQDPKKIGKDLSEVQEQITGLDIADQPRRESQRDQFRKESLEDVTTDVPGMSEQQKLAMRESANSQINNQVQNYSRILASQAGGRGIRGGAAASPQIDLAEKGLQAQNQFQRDLIGQDYDMAMKNKAAYMASLEGRQADDILRRQQYLDYITGKQDQARQNAYGQYYNRGLAKA